MIPLGPCLYGGDGYPVLCIVLVIVLVVLVIVALLGYMVIGYGLLLCLLCPIFILVFYLFLGLGSSDIIDWPARAIGMHLGPGANAL